MSVDKPEEKIAEAREKKEKQGLAKANAKRARKASLAAPKKKKAQKTLDLPAQSLRRKRILVQGQRSTSVMSMIVCLELAIQALVVQCSVNLDSGLHRARTFVNVRVPRVGLTYDWCMSTRSSSSNLVPPLSDPESVIRNCRRNLGDPSLLLDFEEINMNSNNVQGPPPAGPPPQNHNGPPGLNLQMPAPDLRTMKELCQPTMNGRGGPTAPVNIQATEFGLKNHITQQVQNSFQFHGLPGDDANKHLDKFLTVTQSIKQNGVTDDALRLYLFPYSLTHHATAWNDISNFRQLPDESLFKVWERYKLSIDRCPNHNMLPVTQIDTFYNGLTLRHRDTINAAAGGTFMKRRPEECYDLIENMTAHHNDWDTSAHRGESSGSTTSSSSEIAALAQPQCALPSNTVPNPKEQINSITTRSGLTTVEPSIPPHVPPTPREEVEKEPKTLMDEVHIKAQ
ncbi:hypothetical protein Tco_0919027 [Tanacetum coccineum]